MATKAPIKPVKKTVAKKTSPKPTPSAKKTISAKPVKTVAKPAPKKTAKTPGRDFNPKTGFVKGSQQDIIATELLKGGESRREVVERLHGLLDTETRNGTKKPVGNLVAGVWSVLRSRGFVEKSSYKVVAPKAS